MSSLKVNDIYNFDGDALPNNLVPVTATAWAVINETTNTILASEGVSSLTDLGTGVVSVTLSETLDTANIAIILGRVGVADSITRTIEYGNVTPSSFEIYVKQNGTLVNTGLLSVVVLGGKS